MENDEFINLLDQYLHSRLEGTEYEAAKEIVFPRLKEMKYEQVLQLDGYEYLLNTHKQLLKNAIILGHNEAITIVKYLLAAFKAGVDKGLNMGKIHSDAMDNVGMLFEKLSKALETFMPKGMDNDDCYRAILDKIDTTKQKPN